VLEALNMGCCVKGYSNVLSLDIVPSKSFTRHEPPALLGTFLEKKLVQEAMHSLMATRELLTVTSGFGASCIFYPDGSLIEGFAVHQMGASGFGQDPKSSWCCHC
jgi:hypothetical protein